MPPSGCERYDFQADRGDPYRSSSNLGVKPFEYLLHTLINARGPGIQHQLRPVRRFVRIIDTGEVAYLTPASPHIQSLGIAPLTFLERGSDVYLDKPAAQLTDEVPRLLIRRNERRDDCHPMRRQSARHIAGPAKMLVPLGPGEAGIRK